MLIINKFATGMLILTEILKVNILKGKHKNKRLLKLY